jgi:thymidylate kinase
MYTRYQNMQKEFGFTVIEGSQSIDLIQAALRRAVMHLLLDT